LQKESESKIEMIEYKRILKEIEQSRLQLNNKEDVIRTIKIDSENSKNTIT